MIRSILAVSVALLGTRQAPSEFDDLEPCDGIFSLLRASSEPYRLALRSALTDENRDGRCQMVAIPSFEKEWSVCIVCEEGLEPRVVFKRMKNHLWSVLMDALSKGGTSAGYSVGSEAQEAALRHIPLDIETFTAPMFEETADLLDQVWSKALARVRYPDGWSGGCDGTNYDAAHWSREGGHRCGTTWSPKEGSRTAEFVNLAEQMRDFAQAPPRSRKSLELALMVAARSLLTRMERLNEAESRR